MSVLYLLIISSILVAALFLGAFVWAVRNNQLNDQQGAAMRILYDDEVKDDNNTNTK